MRNLCLRIALLALICSTTIVRGNYELQVAYLDSLEKMKESDWQGAVDILGPFLDGTKKQPALSKDEAMKVMGPKYGWFWYHRAYCETKLGNHKDAMKYFERCYVDYPNSPDAKSPNNYQNYSLYKWGESALALQDYPTAKDKFEKFLKEKNPKKYPQDDKYSKGKFHTNLAICQFKADDIDGGVKSINTAVENKLKYLTPPAAIFSAFDALVEAAIKAKQEKVILDFLHAHRSELLADVFVTSQYSSQLLSRSSQAIQAKMFKVPFELISLVPNTQMSINDLNSLQLSLEGIDQPLRDGYNIISGEHTTTLSKKMEENLRSKESNDAISLTLSAALWSLSNNNRAAYAAYTELEDRYSQTKNREGNLYNLIQSCNNLGKVDEAEAYGKTFLRAFPASEKADGVKKMMLTGLFASGDYKQAIEVAGSQLDDLEAAKPSIAHDICLHVLGGSYYYTGKYQEAAKYLEQHSKEYPDSKYNDTTMFMEGSNLSRMMRWQDAGAKLDNYLTKFKDNQGSLYPYALFDRANCHYSTQDYEPALERLKELESPAYIKSPIMDAAFNLKGNILESQENPDRAEDFYKRGLEIAKANGNKRVAGESLNYLIMLLANPERKGDDRSKDALVFYDDFWANYSERSPFQAQVAVAGFPAMQKNNRSPEGLDKMKSVISSVAALPGKPMLEALVNSYREAFLEEKTVADLKEHFYNFDGVSSEDKEALALLRIALISAFEDETKDAEKAEDAARITKLNADTKALFTDLKRDFAPSILTPYSLIKIGDYVREKTSTPREAIVYYDEIINRKNEEFKNRALFGLADLYGGGAVAEKAKAKQFLTSIYSDESTKKATRDRAINRLIQLHVSSEEWEDVNKRALEYLENKQFTKYRAASGYEYARSYDKMGKKKEALSAYVKVNGANLGNPDISAPSTKRIMELLWERNTPQKVEGETITQSDRQFAYNQGWTYIDATTRNFGKFTDGQKALWKETEALVKKYEQSGEIVDMETQKAKK